jgi:hypothetical protein
MGNHTKNMAMTCNRIGSGRINDWRDINGGKTHRANANAGKTMAGKYIFEYKSMYGGEMITGEYTGRMQMRGRRCGGNTYSNEPLS